MSESVNIANSRNIGTYDAHIVTIAAGLGTIFGISVTSAWLQQAIFPQFWLFIASLSIFHLLEFLITALYNPDKLTVDSFLLNNGKAYTYAQICAIIESLIRFYWFKLVPNTTISICMVPLICIGQFMRSYAMVSAGTSFAHTIARSKQSDHHLVTDGIYRFSRHPSYTGYFYWAISLQAFLGNWISFVIFSIVLWRFFYHRIIFEEALLVQFFGQKYIQYKQKVGTFIPFIK